MQYRLLTRRRKSCRVDFHYRRLRWLLRVRLRFRCEGPEDSTDSCRMVGSPFPPPKLMTIDCAIPTAKAARRFTRGLRLRMRSLYGNGYWACEPVCVKYVLSDATAELSGLNTRYCSPRADRSQVTQPSSVRAGIVSTPDLHRETSGLLATTGHRPGQKAGRPAMRRVKRE